MKNFKFNTSCKLAVLLAALFSGYALPAYSSDTTYNVNFSVDLNQPNAVGLTLTGTIVTDGTMGELSASNILSYSLSGSGGFDYPNSFPDFGATGSGNSDGVSCGTDGCGLTASLSGLTFNFDGAGSLHFGHLAFMDGNTYYVDGQFWFSPAYYVNGVINQPGALQLREGETGNQGGPSIAGAQVIAVTTVPEPSVGAQLAVGLLGLSVIRRRLKKSKKA